MNKQEIAFVVLLFAALLGWMMFQRNMAPPPAEIPETEQAEPAAEPQPADVPAAPAPPAEVRAPAPVPPAPEEAAPAPEETAAVPAPPAERRMLPEKTLVLTNGLAGITVSSWGGGIVRARLNEYREALPKDSLPLELDFSASPTLSLAGVPGLSVNSDFDVAFAEGASGALIRRTTESGLSFERSLALGDGYELHVVDTFRNNSSAAMTIPEHDMSVGSMALVRSKAKTRGMSYLGLDTLATHGGEKVRHWGKELSGLFGYRRSLLSCAAPDFSRMPPAVSQRVDQPVSWAAAKNKFFVSIVAPVEGAGGCNVAARRDMTVSNSMIIASVSGGLVFPEKILQPGETFSRTTDCYVGPKKYDRLKHRADHQDDVMEFGFFRVVCKPLLSILNTIYRLIPNYGVAIILLTALVRIVFWPITHKSTESMKRMQALQPEVTAIREKFKDKPQKMNQEVMALYKEHKVNPMSGCLPILVQIPVFIALFTVLRSAVELRFASFLWIRDLSEPEGLFAGMIPVVGSLNILPLFMTATMIWQQRLTPSGGDPQQKKMMMMMPLVMLFIFYNMASALVLYWSTSQCLAIVQLLLQRRKRAAGEK